jgi:hypothetical protein
MRPPRAALTATLALVVAALAAAPPAAAEQLVRLVSPPPGVTLVAGSTMVLEWQPGPALAALPHAEEWEVFVSLDGGRTFLSRLTPHLDIAVRRVTVRVPSLPSGDVRLLIRMGDERDEREQLLPGRYRIVLDPFAPTAWRPRRPARGEAARPGAPGVVAWVEGERDGSHWREYEVERGGLTWRPAVAGGGAALPLVAPLPAPMPKLARATATSTTSQPVAALAARPAALGAAPAPRLASLCRRNL